jgi:2',3'-cyclic-nucleotide 2'-phosphodiesterase/3'-nucleotidase
VPTKTPQAPEMLPDRAHLRIMATTDLHAHVHAYDYFTDQPNGTLGLARIAPLVAAQRAAFANTLLFDNGDFLQGSALGDYVAEVMGLPDGACHPVIAAMNELGYDAATLGNHEFNYGLDFLLRSLSGARFPFVCANAMLRHPPAPGRNATLIAPFAILERQITDRAGIDHPIRIGVIGLMPPQVTTWDAAQLQGSVLARDIVPCAAEYIPRIRAAGADLVIALCHSGIGPAQAQPGMENAATALAALPGLDALILGHSHMVFPSPAFDGVEGTDTRQGLLCGKAAVMAGRFGSHLGVIDLVLDRAGPGWRVARARAQALPVPAADEDAALFAAVEKDHHATLRHIRRRVGQTAVPLNSYFAMLPGNAALHVIAEAQRQHVASLLHGTDYADLPVLSAASPFKMGGRGGAEFYTDVPAGDLAMRHIADLYLFPNRIRALCVTGADLAEWLERAAGLFNQLQPGRQDQPLLNPAMPATEFDVIDGVTWAIDLAQPARYAPDGRLANRAARRITDLRHHGRTVGPDDRFVIATNSYRASSPLTFPGASRAKVVLQSDDTNRDVLRRYLAQADTIRPDPGPGWRFAPMPGTAAWFDSAARATEHLGTLRGVVVEPAGPGPAGYSRFRLYL